MIRAYPGRASVRAGETLALHASGTGIARMHLYRFGVGAEPLEVTQALQLEHAPSGRVDAPWDWPRYDVAIPANARAGAYVAAFEPHGDPDSRGGRALFVVRNRAPVEPLLIILPLFTYQAYNVAHIDGTTGQGEGDCLYSGSRWVTLQRPGGGTGGHPWDEVNVDVYDRGTPRQTFAHWDGKALAWLERHGYGYECCTDLDLHDGTVDLNNYRAVASFGHHEYWTAQMRQAVESYIGTGGNVAFFGGNTCWFEAEYDPLRDALRRVGRWSERPEWMMTGVSYAYGGGKWIGARPPTGYEVTDAAHWIYDGLDVQNGHVFGAQDRLIGYECDGAPAQSDLRLLARSPLGGWDVSDGSGEVAPNGHAALGIRGPYDNVFTASTVDWARLLECEDRYVSRITGNVLKRFMNSRERSGAAYRALVR